MAKKLIWVEIHKKGKNVTPTYYFDFDFLNKLGFPDNEMFSFIGEIKIYAEKEMKERLKANDEKKEIFLIRQEQK
ncbi:hypothetical protein HZB88_03715 [archaeon]|nr:hypothetical protein [archaeon]